MDLITLYTFSVFFPGYGHFKTLVQTSVGNTWGNAMPIGNGRLGAMICGNVEKAIVQLNEHTLWSGGPNRNDNPMALDSLTKRSLKTFEAEMKKVIIPFVEKNYRVLPGPDNRALAGFSLGGQEDIAWKNGQIMIGKLDELKIKHTYSEYPGGHSWPVWRNNLYNFAQLLFK